MAATVSRAHALARKNPADRGPLELADLFCRQARRRVHDRLEDVWFNDDRRTYRVAQGVLRNQYEWLEEGIVGNP